MQVRIGILNLLNQAAITDIVNRFADAMRALGADVNQAKVDAVLNAHYGTALAAE